MNKYFLYTAICFISVLLLLFLTIRYIFIYKVMFVFNNYFDIYSSRKEFYPTNMKWCKYLRDNYKVIRDEFLLYHTKCGNYKRLRDLDHDQSILDCTHIPWDMLMLRCYNIDTNKMRLFPKTKALLQRVPGCSVAMFSILKPGQSLPPHKGIYKGVLRYHLSLIIPKDYEKCYLKVNNLKYSWREGGDVIFDDRFVHEAHNETNEMRVVLFLDIQRKFNDKTLDTINTILLNIFKYNKSFRRMVDNTNSIPTKPINKNNI